MKPKLLALYHFYFPDDVVSARHYQDLCESLAVQGWTVEVWPSNRKHSDSKKSLKMKDSWHDVAIWRVWRPILRQSGRLGRAVNSMWMITAWTTRWIFCFSQNRPQVVLIGTDPVLALIIAVIIRFWTPQVKIAHWCFDLFPEAAVADKKINSKRFFYRFLIRLMRQAYQSCDLIADLGSCMKEKLLAYASLAKQITLTPWAFYEPSQVSLAQSEEREKLFGKAKLGILYSGNFGLAHSVDRALKLASKLEAEGVHFSFSVRGHQAECLKEKCGKEQIPVSFVDFADERQLNLRLEAADIHLVSLKEEWTGTVVPSKFFGAIAAGRPVLFEGSENSSIAEWIREFDLGWVLTEESFDEVEQRLIKVVNDPFSLESMKLRCLKAYQSHFSRQKIASGWNCVLRELASK